MTLDLLVLQPYGVLVLGGFRRHRNECAKIWEAYPISQFEAKGKGTKASWAGGDA